MKRILSVACLTMLGLGIASYATYLIAQPPTPPVPAPVSDAPIPIPAPPAPSSAPTPVTIPGSPMLPTPTPLTPARPDVTVPMPMPSPSSTPTPSPMLPVPTPLSPTPSVELPARPSVPVPTETKPGSGITLPSTPAPMPESTPPQPLRVTDQGSPADDNPSGRQEPAVSLEWVGPTAAKVGQPADFTVVVRNVCNIPVQQVLVRVRIPQGVSIAGTEPKAVTEENVLMWDVGTMLPKQERNLLMKLVSTAKGDLNCQAWVTFTGASAMRIKVREPKLLIKVQAPEKVLVGDGCTYLVTVSNPGDFAADKVRVHADLSDGLESPRGNKIDFDLGILGAGETRSVQVLCGTKTGGPQTCEASAEADGGLKAIDKAVVNVIMPRIDLEATGPKLRYLDRKAMYKFKVTNPGDATAANVVISDIIPPGFKFLNATEGGRHDYSTRTVSWFLGELAPGQSREVMMEVLCINKGEHSHKVMATASRGLKVESPIVTRVEGLSAIALELIDLDDPVEVGAETTYEVRITNTGTQTENDVKLVCVVPEKMQFKSATGPARFTQNGSEIVFEAIPKLAPRADAIFRVTVKCMAPGVVNFKSRITSAILVDPVNKEEATRIYTD